MSKNVKKAISHETRYLILLIVFLVSCQMKLVAPGSEEAFSKAGDNRSKLLRVLRHYEESGDSLKLRAAAFLIGNMTDKGYLTGAAIDEYYAFPDTVNELILYLSNRMVPPFTLLRNIGMQLVFISLIGYLVYKLVTPFVKHHVRN